MSWSTYYPREQSSANESHRAVRIPGVQAFGLSSPQYTIGGTLTGRAGDYWDVLWPHSTNAVWVGFLVLSRSPAQLAPSKVSPCLASRGLSLCLFVSSWVSPVVVASRVKM